MINAIIDLVTLAVVLIWWLVKAASLLLIFGVMVWLLGLLFPVVIHTLLTILHLLAG